MADDTWVRYYQAVQGREPRPLFVAALAAFETDSFDPAGAQAVDLGCGDGTETLALLAKGWRVFAVDQEPAAISRLLTAAPEAAPGLTLRQKRVTPTASASIEKPNTTPNISASVLCGNTA